MTYRGLVHVDAPLARSGVFCCDDRRPHRGLAYAETSVDRLLQTVVAIRYFDGTQHREEDRITPPGVPDGWGAVSTYVVDSRQAGALQLLEESYPFSWGPLAARESDGDYDYRSVLGANPDSLLGVTRAILRAVAADLDQRPATVEDVQTVAAELSADGEDPGRVAVARLHAAVATLGLATASDIGR